MQPRHAAFAILRTLALRDFARVPRTLPRPSQPAIRAFHHSPRHHNEQQPPRAPPQEPLQDAPAPTPPASPKNPRVPRPPIPFDKQAYEMTFTCKPCGTRSSHHVSKQGYHFGSVLIACPECKNRHVISDQLGIFTDRAMTIEDLMRERGQLVKKGTLSEDGDLEFWEDGTTTDRAKTDNGK